MATIIQDIDNTPTGGGGGSNPPVLIFGTTTPLAGSATFNSGVLSLVEKSQVETRILSDTDGTINIYFYEDIGGTDLVRQLSIPYNAADGFQYFAAPAFSNYVAYEFVNSGTPQTDFLYETKVLTTALSGQIVRIDGTIVNGMVAPVVRSVSTGMTDLGGFVNVGVTPGGNTKVTLHDSQTNSRQIIDLNGAAKVGEAIILVGDSFGQATPNPLQWDDEFVNGGSSVTLPGTQRLQTGTTANAEARFQSISTGRFMISQFNIYHGGISVNNRTDTDCTRKWGAFDPINPTCNGVYFCLKDGDWYVCTVKDGVETAVPQANWNGTNASLFNPDPALSVYEIQYNAGAVFFFQGPNFIHVASVAATGDTYAALYNFKVGLEVLNTNGNTNNNYIDFRAAGIYRLGEERGITRARAFTSDTLVKSTAGYVSTAFLSRTGSGGGSAALKLYDGVDNTGIFMARIDIGADDVKGINLNSTFGEALFIELSGTGTITATITSE